MGVVLRERQSRLARVANLPTIPAPERVFPEVPGGELEYGLLVELNVPVPTVEALPDEVEVEIEDVAGLVFVKFRVVEAYVDPGGERFVKVA